MTKLQDLTTTEAAEKLGVTERTVRNMITRKSLHAYKTDPTSKSVYRIPAAEVEKILRARAKTQGARSGV